MRKRITSLFLVLALCLTMMPTAALAEETEGTAQTPSAVEEAADPANGEAKQESQPETLANEDLSSHTTHGEGWMPISTADKLNGIKVEPGTDTDNVNVKLYNGLHHEHYRCNGKDAATGEDKCTEVGGYTEGGVLSFNAWTSANELPTTSGEYYLTKDVTLDSAWSIQGTANNMVAIVLCLNGHRIQLEDTASSVDVIQINAHATLALCDCDGSKAGNGTITGSTKASGVYIDRAGAFVMYGGSIRGNVTGVTNKELFQMYGGSITGNDCGVENLSGTFTMYDGSITDNQNTNNPYGKGGGVCVEGGAFDMHGGRITGNVVSGSQQSYGGGVFVDSGCRFTMYGGSITGNTAGDYGGGVFVNSNDFTVSGDVTISDNTAGSKTSSKVSNVYLPSDKTITVGSKLTGGEASIGVTTANAPAENSYLTIANGVRYTLTEDDLNAFASDSAYGKQFNGNSVVFTNGDLHTHAVCGETAAACKHTDRHSDAVWKPISNESELRNARAGYYYLTDNVTFTDSNTWKPANGVVLCLNGHSITEGSQCTAIEVPRNSAFTLCDCKTDTEQGKITHVHSVGRGVYISQTSTFTMYGGNITGNEVHDGDGGGVCVNGGTFYMYGGSITGNTAKVYSNRGGGNGGGVCVSSGGTFTMNGGTIGRNELAKGNGGGVFVSSGTFTMNGSASITGNTANNGGGVCVDEGAFTMNGSASINNNTTAGGSGNGGGVYVGKGAFTMNGNASIKNNTAYKGGGVWVSGGTFTMSGGIISGNAATRINGCGGVCVSGDNGTFTVSGTVTITGNTANSAKNNVYLSSGKSIAIGADGLTRDARIGITTRTAPENAADKKTKFATGANGDLDYATIFIPDAKDKSYVVNKEGTDLVLSAHQHSWTYQLSTDGKTITATCDAAGCTNTDGGSVTINKPAHTTYGDGNEATATVTGSIPGVTTPTITYKKGAETLDSAPTNAGTYTASITLGSVTASVEYTITKATPKIQSWQGYPYGKTFDGTQLANPTSDRLTIIDGTYDDIAMFNWYTATKTADNIYIKGDRLDKNPIDAGAYIIEAVFKETATTNTAISEKGLTIQQATQYNGTVPAAVNMHPSSASQTFTVDLSEELTKNKVRHGGSLALTAFGITSQSPYVDLTKTALNGNILTITMKPMASNLVGMKAFVSVNVTSRNYEVIPIKITLTLQEKPTVNDITVSMDGWTYGESAKSPVYEKAADAGEATVTYAKADGTALNERPTDAGEYTVTVSYETDTKIHTGTAAFTIRQKSIEGAVVTRDQSEQTYDGGAKKPAVTSVMLDGKKLTADMEYTVAYANNINATKSGSKQAEIIITGKGNYKGIISTTFVINPATLSILDEDKMTATAPYGTAVKNIPVSSATVCYENDGYVEVPGTWKFDGDDMNEIPEVGNTKKYKAVFTPTSGGENYYECFNYIKPSISRAAGSVTDPVAKTDLVYNGKEQALLGTLPVSSTGTVQYSLDGTKYTATPPTGKKAGTYTVWYKVVGDKNHQDVEARSIQVEIKKLTITAPAENATVFTYNGTEQTYALAENGAYTITGNKQTDANETGYTVTVALKDTANTQWTDGTTADKTYTFVIRKAVITVKAKDQTAYVGDKAPALGEDSYTVSGLVGEEKLTTKPTVKYVDADGNEIAPDMTKTGEVKILASGAAASGNYTIRYVDGKLTITTRPSSGGGSFRPNQKPTIQGSEGAKTALSADGTKLTITVEDGYEITDVLVNGVSKGAVAEITGLKTGDKVEVKTAKKTEPTNPTKPSADKKAKLVKGVQNTTIVLKTKLTKDGKILLTWKKSKGYKVDKFEIYCSVKKNSGYGKKPFFTTKGGSRSQYLNTKKLKAGRTYYYKVRGVRIIDGKKYYTHWSNKIWRSVK